MDSPPINIDNFQGPLPLLLQLTAQSEIDIRDVRLQAVISQFDTLMDGGPTLDRGGDFLTVAASLLLLKSRSLFPGLEGEEEGMDPCLEILEKIRQHCTFKELAKNFGEREVDEQGRLPRGVKKEPAVETPSGVAHLTSSHLSRLFGQLLSRAAKRPQPIQEEEWPLPEVIAHVRERLVRDRAIPFDHFFSPSRPKGHLISLFLALLELMKLQEGVVVERGQGTTWIEAGDGN